MHMVLHVAAALPLLHFFDHVEREGALERVFERELEHLALQLLRALLGLALHLGHLAGHVVELLLLFGFFQREALLLLRAHLRFALHQRGIDLPAHLEDQSVLFILELLALVTQRQLRRAQLRELLLRGVELFLQRLGLLPRGLLGRVAGELRLLQRLAPRLLDRLLLLFLLLALAQLRALVGGRAFLLAQLRKLACAGGLDVFERMARKTLLQRELVLALGAGDACVGLQDQRVGVTHARSIAPRIPPT